MTSDTWEHELRGDAHLRSAKVGGQFHESFGIIFDQPKNRIAAAAKPTTEMSPLVTMVKVQNLLARWQAAYLAELWSGPPCQGLFVLPKACIYLGVVLRVPLALLFGVIIEFFLVGPVIGTPGSAAFFEVALNVTLLCFALVCASVLYVLIWHQLRSFSHKVGVRDGVGVCSTGAVPFLA